MRKKLESYLSYVKQDHCIVRSRSQNDAIAPYCTLAIATKKNAGKGRKQTEVEDLRAQNWASTIK